MLLDNFLLHEGHIGSGSSFRMPEVGVSMGVESVDWGAVLLMYRVNFTGISCFSLRG